MRRLAAGLIAAVLAAGCPGRTPTEPTADGIRDAPTTVTVGGKTLFLQASLWRDFQPISPPDGKPLTAVVRVMTAEGSSFPPKVVADTVWIFNGDSAWSPPFEVVTPGDPGSFLEVAMRDGPKWGPGIAVDVVVRLRDARGAAYLLQARNQPIVRTD